MSDGPRRVDVAVIGGGVIGVSAALYMARAGLKVLVLEKNKIGWAASGRAGGAIRRHGRHQTELALAIRSLALWKELAAEADFGFRCGGDLIVAFSDHDAERLARTTPWYNENGVETRLLRGEQIEQVAPGVNPEIKAAAHCAGDAWAYPIAATQAIAQLAQHAGATILEGVEVDSLETSVDGLNAIHGIRCDGGRELRVDCETVVVTSGPWTGQLLDTPIFSRRSQILVSERRPFWLQPFVSGSSIYCAQSVYGNMIIGGGGLWEPTTTDVASEVSTIHRLVSQFLRIFPAQTDLSVIRSWAGTVALTPDHRPLIGEIGTMAGCIVAAGFCGNGFGLAPAVGEAVAALAGGRQPAVDLSPFCPDRFEPARDYESEFLARHQGKREPIRL